MKIIWDSKNGVTADKSPVFIKDCNRSMYYFDLKKAMGHQTMPILDPDEHPDRSSQGLEGPYRQPSGHVLYYDTREGQYYDPRTDMYVSNEEYEAMQRR